MAPNPPPEEDNGRQQPDPQRRPRRREPCRDRRQFNRAPKDSRFKPGQSGNPKGAKPKSPPDPLNVEAAFDRSFSKKIKFNRGGRTGTCTRMERGFEWLSIEWANGKRHARREVLAYLRLRSPMLPAPEHNTIQEALPSTYQAILEAYVERQYDKVVRPTSVLAPPELLDDDSEEENQK